MTIHKLPKGLPVPNPTQPFWQTPPLGISDERTTPELPESAKYVIVGSGISGALIAYKLFKEEPDAEIVMLEARQACSGATGRNGGHCRPGRWLSFKKDVEKYGEEEALRIEHLEEETVQNIGKLIKYENIKCDLREVETLDIFTDANHWKEALEIEKVRREVSGDPPLIKRKLWHGADARERFSVPSAYGAAAYPAYSLSPYKFVCALLHLSLAKGLNLQTATPVLLVKKGSDQEDGRNWRVQTKRGIVRAEKVILATNAYTAALYPHLADFIIPTRAQVALVRPGSEIAGNPALKRTCGTIGDKVEGYLQTRAEGLSNEGDVIVGGGRLISDSKEQPVFDDSTINPKISDYLTGTFLRQTFGKSEWGENGKVLQEWTGIMGYTKDTLPVVGEAPQQPGLFLCVGFNGHGMALTYQSTEALVQLVQGRSVDEWFPRSYGIARTVHA